MPDLPITGGCLCGAVRFEVTEPFVSSNYCHCTRCQRRTGTASSANGRPAPGTFRITRGEDQVKVWAPDEGFEKAFCATCGGQLFSRNPDDHEQIGVRLGAVDGDPGIRPQQRNFTAYAAVWEPIPDDGLPRHAERP
jgi:hypothetical protein